MICGSRHPFVDLACELVAGHAGDHRESAASWANLRTQAAEAEPNVLVWKVDGKRAYLSCVPVSEAAGFERYKP